MTSNQILDKRLTLQFLRALDAIDKCQSLLKASASLGLSQPALSKSLREYEEAVQFRLFERHPRGMSTTEAGAVFVRSARRILAELQRLNEELEFVAVPKGDKLTLGVLPVAGAGVVPGALTRLRASHPEMTVRVRQGRADELLPLLALGEIDLMVGRLPETLVPEEFETEAFWSEPASIVARSGHPVFSAKNASIEGLRRWNLMLLVITPQIGDEIEGLLEAVGLLPRPPLRSNSYGFIREMLHGTDMLAAMPQPAMAGDLIRGTLRIVPLSVKVPERPAGLIMARGRSLSPAGLAFVSCLRTYMAQLAGCGLPAAVAA